MAASGARSDKDLIVFGATGVAARMVINEIIKGASTRWRTDFRWAIAGRSRSSLESLRAALSNDHAQSSVPLPDVIIADVKDDQSLLAMARQTRVLLNCVGPYRTFGEPVVKACIDVGADYLDLCGEPGFIERMHLLYHDAAVKADISIVHASAFDSVPCDLGVVLCKKLLGDRGAYPSAVEMVFSLTVPTTLKQQINYATYESAIKGFSDVAALRQVRKELARVRPKPAPVGPAIRPPAMIWLLARYGIVRDPRVGGYLVPYFFSDPAVVRLTQSLTLHMKKSSAPPPREVPVHFAAYIRISTLLYLIQFLLYFIVFQYLVLRKWGRELLYRYPGVFTNGLVAKNIDTNDKKHATAFTQTFFARGYSPSLHPTPVNTPDVEVRVRISGPEPGYMATAVVFVEAASVLLRRRNDIAKGVLTPAVAFGPLDTFEQWPAPGEGGVFDALQRDGRVRWSVVKG